MRVWRGYEYEGIGVGGCGDVRVWGCEGVGM